MKSPFKKFIALTAVATMAVFSTACGTKSSSDSSKDASQSAPAKEGKANILDKTAAKNLNADLTKGKQFFEVIDKKVANDFVEQAKKTLQENNKPGATKDLFSSGRSATLKVALEMEGGQKINMDGEIQVDPTTKIIYMPLNMKGEQGNGAPAQSFKMDVWMKQIDANTVETYTNMQGMWKKQKQSIDSAMNSLSYNSSFINETLLKGDTMKIYANDNDFIITNDITGGESLKLNGSTQLIDKGYFEVKFSKASKKSTGVYLTFESKAEGAQSKGSVTSTQLNKKFSLKDIPAEAKSAQSVN
ncbi:hypothetical protein R6G69_07175 [Actinotignum urinale]|uniref:hypothetical protein n=1 Tax=Actinotignum urinale TaxID=190146 RepID=UPI002A7EDFF9|nr:hypothetical protein [Actinotignum urinale]MDY5129761.1 hypothetical protein [Actinotignum urinale]